MAPVIKALEAENSIEHAVCVTAQHRDMLDQVLTLFDINPDFDLDIMADNQDLMHITTAARTCQEQSKPALDRIPISLRTANEDAPVDPSHPNNTTGHNQDGDCLTIRLTVQLQRRALQNLPLRHEHLSHSLLRYPVQPLADICFDRLSVGYR